ncbi:hypothetical protein LJR153_000366 [Paenibacillus sp. LjRoot153]|uniref:hypothetical protein n=1 Tax=Paenibacillus sp. LjRoot153 TaxID=3342270 RepID=UPI003ECD5900
MNRWNRGCGGVGGAVVMVFMLTAGETGVVRGVWEKEEFRLSLRSRYYWKIVLFGKGAVPYTEYQESKSFITLLGNDRGIFR